MDSPSSDVQGLVVRRAQHAVTGVQGVPVSDGEQVVLTDHSGRFLLKGVAARRPIFICTPSGSQPVGDFFQHHGGRGLLTFELASHPVAALARYSFVVLADYQWELNDRVYEVFRRTINDPGQPQFVVHLGDLFRMMEGFPSQVARRYYAGYRKVMTRLQFPVFNAIGNHDQVNGPPVSPDEPEFGDGLFEELLGPTYYSFDRGDNHHIVLNSFEIVDKHQHSRISERQLRWLRADLACQTPGKPVLLFLHRPPMQLENEEALLLALAGHPVLACFGGDWHRDAVFRCPGEPFPTIITVGPEDNVESMPFGYRMVWVDGQKLSHVYRLMHTARELHVVRPAPGSAVAGSVEVVVTEHVRSDRKPAPAYSTGANEWIPFRPAPLPGTRTEKCAAGWAEWQGTWHGDLDSTLLIRAAEDSPPSEYLKLPLRVVASPIIWQLPVAQNGDLRWRSRPVLAGELLFLGDDAGVCAFSATTGRVVWRHRETARWVGTPLALDDRIIATSWEGNIVALARDTGQILWRTQQPCAIPPCRPCPAGPFVLIGGMKRDGIWDGSLSCLEAATGKLAWSLRHDHPFFSAPLYADGRIWANCGDRVHCLSLGDGKVVWTLEADGLALYPEMAMARGKIFAADGDGGCYVIVPELGTAARKEMPPRAAGLVSDGELLFFCCGMRGLRAYDPETCQEVWRVYWPGAYFQGRPTLRDGAVWAACSDGNLYRVDGATGRITWGFQFGSINAATPEMGGARGYLTTEDGLLVAFAAPA